MLNLKQVNKTEWLWAGEEPRHDKTDWFLKKNSVCVASLGDEVSLDETYFTII